MEIRLNQLQYLSKAGSNLSHQFRILSYIYIAVPAKSVDRFFIWFLTISFRQVSRSLQYYCSGVVFKDSGYWQPWTWSRALKLTRPDATIVCMNVPRGPAHLCTLLINLFCLRIWRRRLLDSVSIVPLMKTCKQGSLQNKIVNYWAMSSTVFTRAPNQYSRCLATSSDLLDVLPAKTRLKDNNIVKTA